MKATVTEQPFIHIVDDDASVRTALGRVLNASGYEVRTYGSATDFLLNREGTPRGCVILDIRMPGGPSGMELHRSLAKQEDCLPVIFITGHGDVLTGVRAIKDGAFDFLIKPVERDLLLDTVRRALALEKEQLRQSSHQRDIREKLNTLSPAEKEVFRRLVEGQANKEIAWELGCSDRTIKTHRAQVMMKMDAKSFADLVRMSVTLENAPV